MEYELQTLNLIWHQTVLYFIDYTISKEPLEDLLLHFSFGNSNDRTIPFPHGPAIRAQTVRRGGPMAAGGAARRTARRDGLRLGVRISVGELGRSFSLLFLVLS
jgi:hypothetical protein